MNEIVDAEVMNAKKSGLGKASLAVAILAMVLGGAYAIWMVSGTGAVVSNGYQSHKLVVLNSSKLIAASTKQIMDNKALSPEQVDEVSKKLAVNIRKLVESYRDNGYIVLNSNSVLSAPAELDITANFAEQLGVKID